MTEEGKKYLFDVSMAITHIEAFLQEINDFNTYEVDIKTQSAIERQLAIIGKALNKFRKVVPEVAIKNDTQIIAFRNR